MAEGNSPPLSVDEKENDEDLVKKLPSIPSSDEVNQFETKIERQGSIDERLHRLRAVTQGVIAARKFRRSSSIQGKYVAITPNERDNLEHIQHMTEDITARLDKLRDLDSAPTDGADKEADEASRSRGDIYVPTAVQGKFVEFVPFDACASRPASLGASDSSDAAGAAARNDISPLPPLPPPVDTFAFFNGDINEMEDDEGAGAGDATEGASVTATLEKRLRMLGEDRMQ